MSPANFMVGSPAGLAHRSSRLANGIARERRAPAERSKMNGPRGPRDGGREDRGGNSRASPGGRQKPGHPGVGGNVFWQNGAILPKLKSKVPGTDGPLRR